MGVRPVVILVLAVLLSGCGDDAVVSSTGSTFPGPGSVWARVPDDEAASGGRVRAVVAGGPGLVAVGTGVGEDGRSDGMVWVSADGYIWTPIDEEALGGPAVQIISSAAVGEPGLVAVGHDRSVEGEGDTRGRAFLMTRPSSAGPVTRRSSR